MPEPVVITARTAGHLIRWSRPPIPTHPGRLPLPATARPALVGPCKHPWLRPPPRTLPRNIGRCSLHDCSPLRWIRRPISVPRTRAFPLIVETVFFTPLAPFPSSSRC